MRSKPPSPAVEASARAIQLNRTVRIFLSSTFRDFGEERDLLVRKVFTGLRARLKDRFVELVDVDLRWGITIEQAERGQVLPICLVEIERARPFFVGMLGERYGWVPPADAYATDLIERQPWLDKHRGGKSVTELEILHGVLNNPKMAGRAFFYFRSAAYARNKGGEYLPVSRQDAEKQRALKARIRKSRFPVVQYRDPVEFAKRLELDLWTVLDETFPAGSAPDAFEREASRHEVYAAPRRRLYLGGERYLKALDTALEKGAQRILIEGASGGGKSALIANWLDAHQRANPKDLVHVHYLGASADAASPHTLLRRLIEAIKRSSQSTDEVAADPQKLIESLPLWLATANAYAGKHKTRWVIVFDALNSLTDLQDLRWFPEFLPARIHLVVSCLPGPVADALSQKGKWKSVLVKPLSGKERQALLTTYLARYNKTLPKAILNKILAHTLTSNPLFLRTLGEELRIFGVHEQLEERLDYYLTSQTVGELFGRVLERVEGDCGKRAVKEAITAILVSRAGLSEEEILGIAKLVPATWAPIRNALDEALLESNGRITFAHDYLRAGVRDRYLATDTLQRKKYVTLARWFAARAADARRAEEEPFQWRQAKDWKALKACLTNRAMFEAIYEHRSDEELLAFWLDLERVGEGKICADYELAWTKWVPDETTQEAGELAARLEDVFTFSGHFSNFTERLARLSLAAAEIFGGIEHEETCRLRLNLSILLSNRGDYAESEIFTRRGLAIAEKVFGVGQTTGAYILQLASLRSKQDDYEEATLLMRRALNIFENESDPRGKKLFIDALHQFGLLHLDMGDSEAAKLYLQRALATAEKIYGSENLLVSRLLNSLGELLRWKHDFIGAEVLFIRGLDVCVKILGTEHTDTSVHLDSLASLRYQTGDLDAAESLYRQTLAIQESLYGPLSIESCRVLGRLANVLDDQEKYQTASVLYQKALDATVKHRGSEHSEVGTLLNNMAASQQNQGNLAAAEPLYRKSLAILEKFLSPTHWERVAITSNLESLLKNLNRTPDITLLLSRGDFITIVSAAKNLAQTSSQFSLTPILILMGAVTTIKQNTIWSQTIASLLTEKQQAIVIKAAERCGVKIDDGTYQTVEALMPLSDELKRIIAEHMHAPMQKFIDSLLASL